MSFKEIYEEYFSLNLRDYSNIGVDLEISKILLWLFIGIIIATIVLNTKRAYTSILIKRLLRYKATDEDSAKTVNELKVHPFGAGLALSSGGRIRKIIAFKGQKEYTYEEYSALIKSKNFKEEKVDFKTVSLYIRDNSLQEAEKLAETATPTVLNTVLQCILFLCIYICLLFLMPEILTLINKLLG